MTDKAMATLRPPLDLSTLTLFEQMHDMVFVMSVDPHQDFRYTMLNPSAMKASGLNEYAYGATFEDVVEPAEAEFLHAQYGKAAQFHQPVTFALEHGGQVGESLISPIVDANGQCTYVMGVVRDITERFQREKNLEYLAFRDHLTGLFNRHALSARLRDAIKTAQQTCSLMAIFMIDCDHFKMINDTHGHTIGDMALREVAERLQTASRHHTIARTGGDEFVMVCICPNEIQVIETAEHLLQNLRTPWQHECGGIGIPASIGVSIYPTDSMDPRELLESADKAQYTAKQRGGDQYRLFQERHTVRPMAFKPKIQP